MSAPGNPRKRGLPSSDSSPFSQKPPVTQAQDRKRLKIQDARAIAVQSTEPALKAGQLDINLFVKSREFEIRALEDAMASSKYGTPSYNVSGSY